MKPVNKTITPITIMGRNEKKNLFGNKKKIMRLCAIAMAEDGEIDEMEANAIASVVLQKWMNDDLKDLDDYAHGFDGSNVQILNETSAIYSENQKEKYRIEINPDDLVYRNGVYRLIPDFVLQSKVDDEEAMELVGETLKDMLGKTYNSDHDDKRIEERMKAITPLIDIERLKTVLTETKCNLPENSDIKELLEVLVNENIHVYIDELFVAFFKCRYIVDLCRQELDDVSMCKSICMNVDALSTDEIKRELRDMMLVIRADMSIMDREREAFRVFCKLFRIKNTTALWQELTQWNEAELVGAYSDYQKKDFQIYRKDAIDVNDFKTIKKSIVFYDIKGPLLSGVYHVLQREELKKRENIFRGDKKMSRYAFILFALSAVVVYLNITDTMHGGHGEHGKELLTSHTFWEPFARMVTDICRGQIDWLVDIPFLLIAGVLVFPLIYWGYKMICIRIKPMRKMMNYREKAFYEKDKGKFKIVWPVFAFVVALLIYIIGIADVSVQSLLDSLFAPFCLLIMMVSIEWLIFMREKYQGNTVSQEHHVDGDSSILIILVVAAVLSDVCLGIIELGNEFTGKDVVDKVASALFLGCICFFLGKFIENHRAQQEKDVHDMNSVVKELGERIQGNTIVEL